MKAADELTTGDYNVCLGYESGLNITTGDNNIVLGKYARPTSATTSNEITLGHTEITKFRIPGINFSLKDNGGTPSSGQVLTADGSGDGYWATSSGPTSTQKYVNQTSTGNTFAGENSTAGTSGQGTYNTCFGYKTGYNLDEGQKNIFIGANAGMDCENGDGNIAIGYEAGKNGDWSYNNTCIGTLVANKGDGMEGNVFVGKYCGGGDPASSEYNVGMGTDSFGSLSSGQSNTCLGTGTGSSITSGQYNVCIGRGANVSSNSVSGEAVIGDSNVNKFRIPGIGVELRRMAWVEFHGVNDTINASHGVSSVSDTGSADYEVNFSTSFPDAYYVVAGSVTGSTSGGYHSTITSDGSAKETGKCPVRVRHVNDATAEVQSVGIELLKCPIPPNELYTQELMDGFALLFQRVNVLYLLMR